MSKAITLPNLLDNQTLLPLVGKWIAGDGLKKQNGLSGCLCLVSAIKVRFTNLLATDDDFIDLTSWEELEGAPFSRVPAKPTRC